MDFRHLNAFTKKSKFPVPIFDQLMDELANSKWFSTLDLRAGFHQILLQPGEEFKMAFQTHLGQYEFRVMAFGLTGAPGTFQAAMNNTLAPGLRHFVLVFFDDILVYSPTFEDHVDHLRQVFQWLRSDQWKLKLSKCTFARESISYLGHIVSSQGLSIDPAKVQAVMDWPVLSSVKELWGFLGLAGCLSDTSVFWPSPSLTSSRKITFSFGPSITIQHSMFSSMRFVQPQYLLCRTSLFPSTLRPTLQGQVWALCGHPIAFISKALSPRNQGLSIYEKEYLAILVTVEQWRHYLLQAEFYIYTDHRSLIHLNEQRLHTAW